MCRIAILSIHTSPLALPGTQDSGGMNVYVRELAHRLSRRGHQVDIFTRSRWPIGPTVEGIDRQVRLVHIPAGPPKASKEELYRYLPEFVRGVIAYAETHGGPYDLVHSHYWLSGWAGQILKARWGVPHLIMFHTLGEAKVAAGGREPIHRLRAERHIAQEADRIVCASRSEAETLARLYGVPWERMAVIPCGVDTHRFRPYPQAEARRLLGLPLDRPIALFVGRLEPVKGLDTLLRALALLPPAVLLLVVGGDPRPHPRQERLRRLAQALGLAGRVAFRPAVPHHMLPLWYNAADLCIIPSRYETFGMVALEAMACGVPVIASRVGGLQETIIDGVTGLLVWPPRPEALAHSIASLLADEEARRRLGEEARRRAQAYDWESVASQVESLYRQLLGPRRLLACHGP